MCPYKQVKPAIPMRLMNADGSGVAPVGTVNMRVTLNGVETNLDFVVVDKLSAPAILGCDFLKK